MLEITGHVALKAQEDNMKISYTRYLQLMETQTRLQAALDNYKDWLRDLDVYMTPEEVLLEEEKWRQVMKKQQPQEYIPYYKRWFEEKKG